MHCDSASDIKDTEMIERFRGAMFGVAVGDALGATLEFMSREEVQSRWGILKDIVGGGWLSLEPGQITDDTEMTLAVAEGIAENPKSPVEAAGRRFVEWYLSHPPDIGNTVRTAIESFLQLGSWEAASRVVGRRLGNRCAGNGALMRTVPVSLAYHSDRDEMLRISRELTLMTHPHQEAEAASAIYNDIGGRLLAGESKEESVKRAVKLARACYGGTECRRRLMAVGTRNYDDLNPTGYVVDTLEASIWCFLNSDGFEEAVVNAVNLGQDADTTGAVTGGLAGIYYGYGSIPRRWLEALSEPVRERIWRACDDLTAISKLRR